MNFTIYTDNNKVFEDLKKWFYVFDSNIKSCFNEDSIKYEKNINELKTQDILHDIIISDSKKIEAQLNKCLYSIGIKAKSCFYNFIVKSKDDVNVSLEIAIKLMLTFGFSDCTSDERDKKEKLLMDFICKFIQYPLTLSQSPSIFISYIVDYINSKENYINCWLNNEVAILKAYNKWKEEDDKKENKNKLTSIRDKKSSDFDYGDKISLKSFIISCIEGEFIDDDGSGSFYTGENVCKEWIEPSDILSHVYDLSNVDGVIWFNK